MLKSVRRLGGSTTLRSSSTISRWQRTASTGAWSYEEAQKEIFGSREPRVAFLGTGPMALSIAAQMLSTATTKNVAPPKMVLLTEQDSYYEALRANGFKVVDERDGSEFVVKPEHLIVVKSVGEYEALHPDAPPQLVFGTMQMGKKTERWGMVQPLSGEKVTVLSAANGVPYTAMMEAMQPLKGRINTGHLTAYVKARAEIAKADNTITVTCTDAGLMSVGAVGADASDKNAWFGSVAGLLEGPIYDLELSKNAKQEAMNKVVRNLTNPICLAATCAQYSFVAQTDEVTAYRYGVHMEKRCFANALNKATFEAGRALGLSPADIAHHIVENLKYVMGPVVNTKEIDMDKILHQFEDGLEDILRLRKSEGVYSRNVLFEKLSDKVMFSQLYSKISRHEVGSTHPPTDAQAAATARPSGLNFGEFIPVKPIENKIKFLIDIGLDVLNTSEAEAKDNDMSTLYGFSALYDAYNQAAEEGTPFKIPDIFFKTINGCEDETRLLSNIDDRILKHDWRSADLKNTGGISVSAMRKQWLGESAIRNAKLIGELTQQGLKFLRFDVGGVALEESPHVIQARIDTAGGNNKYSPLCENETLEALAKFYSDTSHERKFKPSEVMVLGMREKGALPWMLDFIGNGPMFVPRPTYNPNPSAGLYHHRQVLSFDVSGPNRYLPMIEALRLHKGGGVVVLPIIGNPYSTAFTEEEEQGLVEVLKANPKLALIADHAYRGYDKFGDVDAPGGLQNIGGGKTRDIMEAGGFYDQSPIDPVTGKLTNLRVTLHSSSKLFNDASGPGTCSAHEDTISFLGDMLRGSYTQV